MLRRSRASTTRCWWPREQRRRRSRSDPRRTGSPESSAVAPGGGGWWLAEGREVTPMNGARAFRSVHASSSPPPRFPMYGTNAYVIRQATDDDDNAVARLAAL